MVAFDEWMRLAGPGPPPLRSLSSCQSLKPEASGSGSPLLGLSGTRRGLPERVAEKYR